MLLYHNKVEYSRVVEVIEVTEEGMFVKDQTPEDYSGASLQIEVVHQITFTDAAGCIEILKLDNPTPQNKKKQQSTAAIHIDGKEYRPGSSPVRTWTTRVSSKLSPQMKNKAEITHNIMRSDGDSGTPI